MKNNQKNIYLSFNYFKDMFIIHCTYYELMYKYKLSKLNKNCNWTITHSSQTEHYMHIARTILILI